ncbi:calcitonin gene-related peptide-like isoform X1 [Amazona aestiva]|uniref:Calcitonin gene-related peptide-like isoform X1 n=3 Tax=Amazona TaxID=12929 RepID=A0A0Q3U086_AMAAE|nr:calcitonin gene-related peptide-like isoform X1 [Amazona aestiva]
MRSFVRCRNAFFIRVFVHACARSVGERSDDLFGTCMTEWVGKQPFLDVPLSCREEIMVALKISSFLAVYALVVCQMDSFQAAPVRPGLESITDRVTLSDYEARRLLNALVKEFIQMTAEELEQASEGNSLDRPISKRCASLSTCVLGKLSQELHKLQTYPRTDVGAGTPGKKRNVLNDMEHERYAKYGEPLGDN